MKFRDWCRDLDFQLLQGDLDTEVDDIVYDSRKARENTVFVCMKGTRSDSHKFAEEVVRKGCRVLVVEREVPVLAGVTVILVKNGRNALALMSAARFDYPARKMTTIGVTGTKGKTTTTHMLKAILEAAGKKTGMIGTIGVVIGDETYPTVNTTPESYQLQEYFSKMVEAGCEYMIMEVSSQGLKMHRVDGITFDYGIFMNISRDHIGPSEHANFAEYLMYKSQLFNRCKVGFMNQDDEHYDEIVRNADCELHTFGIDQPADYRAEQIRYIAEENYMGVEFRMTGKDSLDIKVGVPGKFNVSNALAAASLCSYMGIDRDQICHGLEHITINGRMEIVYSSKRCTVIVDYAHNAVSMESLLSTLSDYHPKRLICIFGCGGNRSRERRYTMGEIGGRYSDLCILTADNSRYERVEEIIADIRIGMAKSDGEYIVIADRREAIRHGILHSQPGDLIAVIGKGHENYQEIRGVRHPFSDRAVVEEAVKELEAQEE